MEAGWRQVESGDRGERIERMEAVEVPYHRHRIVHGSWSRGNK